MKSPSDSVESAEALRPRDAGVPAPMPGLRRFGMGLAALVLAFSPWLFSWVRFGFGNDLSSYVLLIPLVSAYLIRQNVRGGTGTAAAQPGGVGAGAGGRNVPLAIGLGVAAAGMVAAAFFVRSRAAADSTTHDYLAPAMAGFLLAALSWGIGSLGLAQIRRHWFAIGFLFFAVPLPSWAVNGIEMFFQHTSADAASLLMEWTRLPNFRTGLRFQLAGITVVVAQECSGIRSSIVLFIVSVLAGHLLLAKTSHRLALALFVIPLAIVRNGFRILTIAALCTHVGPHMIDSVIHRKGGPIFFILSLGPLFLFLYWLRRLSGRPNPAP